MKKTTPPKYAHRLLTKMIRRELHEEVLGDLDEKFYDTVRRKSKLQAKANYWYQSINYLRPFAMKKGEKFSATQYAMLANYSKITFRNLANQKFYAAINIFGLSIGLMAFLLIALYVQHELSFDNFFPNGKSTYRIYQKQEGNVYLGSEFFGVTPVILATVLMDEYPEVEKATSIQDVEALITSDDKRFWEFGISTDTSFFEVLHFDMAIGNPSKALTDKHSIALTQTLAKKIFGKEDPIGKSIQYSNSDTLTVTAVLKDPPVNSSIQFSFVVNSEIYPQNAEELRRPKWTGNNAKTFLTLRKGADPHQLEVKLPDLFPKYRDENYKNYPFKDIYYLENINDIHFHTDINMDVGVKSNPLYVSLFAALGGLILVLACVNYTNLAIARSIKRGREVGLRKSVGAHKGQIVSQFLSESVLITFIALMIAIGLTYLLLPYFANLVDRRLSIDGVMNIFMIPSLLLLVLLVGLMSGSYPAFFMGSLRVAQVLKGNAHAPGQRFSLQRLLIVGQFAISIALVVGSLVIYEQLKYIQEKELGYEKANILVVRNRDWEILKSMESLRNKWLQNTAVLGVTVSEHLPSNITSSTIISSNNPSHPGPDIAIYQSAVDYDYIEMYGLKLIAGRNFSRDIKTDATQAYILNETAIKALGWSAEEAVGKKIAQAFGQSEERVIIGVIKDFHMHSMHLAVQPLMVSMLNNYAPFISVKVKTSDLPKTIAFLESTMKKVSPFPFEYQFLDEHFNELYKIDVRIGQTFGFFTVLSLLIASLGLFGLAAFMSGQRTKEIGIRKVLGASVNSIVNLLTRDFLVLVGIAFVIAIPIAWYAMYRWLEGFAYKVELQWWMFALAGILAVGSAYLAISYQSLKAALMNPASSLKSD